jgi:hypothetical protein
MLIPVSSEDLLMIEATGAVHLGRPVISGWPFSGVV